MDTIDPTIVVALVTFASTVIGSAITAFATIRAAEGAARGTEGRSLVRSARNRVVGRGVGIGLLLGVIAGLIANALFDDIRAALVAGVKGDLNAVGEVASVSVNKSEDQLDVRPWEPIDATKTQGIFIGKVDGRGRDGALRMRVGLEKWQEEKSGEYAGVKVVGRSLPNDAVSLAMVWLYVPKNEASVNAGLHAHLIGYSQDPSGRYIGLYGPDVELTPGKWTMVPWGGSYKVEIMSGTSGSATRSIPSTYQSQNQRLTEINVTVWAERGPYTGSVYVDDLRLFATEV